MSKRLVFILWLAAIALCGATYFVKSGENRQNRTATKRSAGQTLFESFPATDVAAITLNGAEGSVHLVKKDGKWTVTERDGYPANVSAVNELLRTLKDLKIVGGIEAGPSFAPRFGMDAAAKKPEDHGYVVTFADASGKELAGISLGKNLGGEDANPMAGGGVTGRFIRNNTDDTGIYKTSEMFASLSDDPKRWLSEEFIQIEKPKTITVTQPGKSDLAWKLNRPDEGANFALEGAKPDEPLDDNATSPLKNLLSFARFDDVVPAAEVEKRIQADQKRVATVQTVEGFTYTLTFSPAKPAEKKAANDAEAPPAAENNFFMTVEVAADLPKERKKEADEKPEDAKTKDEAFQKRSKELQDKLAKEQGLKGRTFEVTQWTVDALTKDRASLLKKPGQPAPAGAGIPGLPPGFQLAPRGPVEAVTPPIAVPPQGEDGQ